MPELPAFEHLLRRDRIVTVAGLLILCGIAWLYIVEGAGLGMSARQMTTLAFFPHQQAEDVMQGMPGLQVDAGRPTWGFATWALMIGMWWIMMIAMMTPSAAPTILLYARVHRAATAQGQFRDESVPIGAFAAGYLTVWLGFAIGASGLHWALERAGLVSTMMMGSRSRWLSAAVLITAGLYQLSPLKNVCLAQCRAPASFLARHWRPHASGALRLGARHGVYCVGCCWMLMTLLFVGGVMNLVWIAALTTMVLIERILPRGQWIGRSAGVALAGWGVATLVA
ncbi:MAG: Metal-binding protein [Gammaproteobacteria bacterium]|nr:Metal-binding protein [Gammaproteobacteria bacterium]